MILFAPAPTGSGHNMRVLSIGRALKDRNPDIDLKVALASLQDVFTPMFEGSGIEVIDVAGQLMDYSKKSNLSRQLDWGSYIAGYISNTFLSSERMLAYLAIIEEHKPRVVISDFNMAACLAAIFSRTPLVFVTERYDFTLCQLTDEDLSEGGFELNAEDLNRARLALHKQFSWMIEQSQLVLTDKPYIPEMDNGTPVASALHSGKAHFVGPMIRDFTQTNASTVRADLGLGDGPFVVASISGTTMFAESKQNLLNGYLEAFERLRAERPELKMVLLGRQDIAPREGVISVPYYPDWMGLLREASLLVSAPGWITVTEIAALNIPTLFVLPSKSEYHEAEALDRLGRLGFPTYLGCEAGRIAELIGAELDKDTAAPTYFGAHQRVAAPDGLGAHRAASRILSLAQ
ncbi:hypothetical protein JYG34_22445 [Pseudomonas entomophila]|uniref:hypothetical protein n=1 Tax=Pseudomonas entomophila TaxID=312306 RepID=UPI001BCACE88|nr:hypothetical protein [Pseudomonas entomophila]QVM90730.1 hypothetical protein JYG34_22445 [Pseudomonas entomophila]